MRLLPLVLMAVMICSCGSAPTLGRVTAAQEVGVTQMSSSIVGRDGASSGLAWGHDVWAFGDTVMNNTDDEGTNWHFNSFALSDDFGSPLASTFYERAEDGGALEYFILPPTPMEDAFNVAHFGDSCPTPPGGQRWAVWPGDMVFDEANGRLLISYGLVPPDGEVGGSSYAVWSDWSALRERSAVSDSNPHGITLFSDNEAKYDQAPTLVGDQLYAFASTLNGWDRNATLARVPVNQLFDRSAWTYWAGGDWSSSPSDAQVLFGAGLGLNMFYDAYLDAWVVLYAGPFSNDVMYRTAKTLEGPWSGQSVLFTASRPNDTSTGTYDAYAHVELTPDNGHTMFVTFSRSNGNGWFGSEIVVMQVTFEP